MEYKPRACEICGQTDSQEVFSWEKKSRIRSGWHLWKVRNVVCKDCGFAFVSPAPTLESLNHYYANSHMLVAGAQINSAQRIDFLKYTGLKYADSVVEIGGNQLGEFAVDIMNKGAQYLNCEINMQVKEAVNDLSIALAIKDY